MEEQVGTKSMLRSLKENLPYMVEKLPEMPSLIYEALKNSAEGQDQEKQLQEIREMRAEFKRANQRNIIAIGGASLLISAFIVFGLAGEEIAMFMGAPILSWILGGIGSVFIMFSFQD